MDFIQARNFNWANRGDEIRLVVIHSMEAPEKPGTARAVAKWFAGPLAPQASAHYCVDNVEVIGCVKEKDVAWGAPHANRDGIHVELAGYAAQTPAQWGDDYSVAELRNAAKLCADIARRHGIPPVKLTTEQVGDGRTKGFCGHADVTRAFKTFGGHTDPGVSFPWINFMQMVADEMGVSREPEGPNC